MGYRTYLATAKPQHIARQILQHFALDQYFDSAYGSVHDKAALIGDILKVESIDPADALMVGDREHDILSAKKCMVRGIAVTYGYGAKDELSAANPNYVFETLGDLADSLIDLK